MVDDGGARLAMGSTTGNLWVSDSGGEAWAQVDGHLPPIAQVAFLPERAQRARARERSRVTQTPPASGGEDERERQRHHDGAHRVPGEGHAAACRLATRLA